MLLGDHTAQVSFFCFFSSHTMDFLLIFAHGHIPHHHALSIRYSLAFIRQFKKKTYQIHSLIYFATLPPTSVNQNSLLLQRDEPELLRKPITPYTFGAVSKQAAAEWKAQIRNLDKATPLVIFSKVCRHVSQNRRLNRASCFPYSG